MRVIVCGAGQVGGGIAHYLAREDNDVTIIDQSQSLVEHLSNTLDIRGIHGHGAHPDVLERAGAADADMLVAVTLSDEVNMVACQVGHSLFDVPTKIARVRHNSYLDPTRADLFSRDHMPIDVLISPELAVAKSIVRRLEVPGTFDLTPLADGRLRLVGVRCEPGCPVVNTPLRQLTTLFPTLLLEVVTIIRNDRPRIPSANDQMLVGDMVYFIVAADQVDRAMVAFGHTERAARRVLILGGGNVGAVVASKITEQFRDVSVRMIEHDLKKAESIAQRLDGVTVIHGDALDPDILDEADASEVETVIAVTNDDETNVLGSLLAKRQGCKRAITLVNKSSYASLVSTLDIDSLVNPRGSTVATILHHVRRGRIRGVFPLRDGFAEVMEIEILETSGLANVTIEGAHFPPGVLVGAIVRGEQVILPRPDLRIRPRDRIILVAEVLQVRKVEQMVAVSLEFF